MGVRLRAEPRINIATFGVKNIKQSIRSYKDRLGWPLFTSAEETSPYTKSIPGQHWPTIRDWKDCLYETRGKRSVADGDYTGFKFLKSIISNPPRANSPENYSFEEAMSGLTQYLMMYGGELPGNDLNELAGLEDIFEDVIYYLEDDPVYDVGHDFIHADYSKVRELAGTELKRRNCPD